MQEPQGTLALFAKFIARTMGLHFRAERHSELDQKMVAVAKEAGYANVEEYQLWLMSAPLSRVQLETLARALTIGETYFLRDPQSYRVLEQELLPGLVSQRRATDKSLRFWSAGCSTGEEPYTLAILLSRVIPDLASWNISLVATDINPQALERGRLGIYSQWSFRNAPPWLMDYFTKCDDGRFQIIPRIRDMVRFDYLNLADNGLAAPCCGTDFLDVIFCRNVMLYFEPKQIQRTMARFHAALREGGSLFVGPTEVDQHLVKGFACRRFAGAFVLRKEAAGQEAAPRHGLPPAAGFPWDKAQGTLVSGGRSTLPSPEAASGADIARFAASQATASLAAAAADSRAEVAGGDPVPATLQQAGAPDELAEALALFQAGRYEEAAESVRRSLQAGSQPAHALALGARAFANVGRFSEAREFCEQAIATDLLSADNHYLLSIILEQQGDAEAAAASLKHVLFIDQEYLLAYFALGNLHRQAGDERESERNFDNALRLLERCDPHEVLPEAEGMTAGHLAQIIRTMTKGRS